MKTFADEILEMAQSGVKKTEKTGGNTMPLKAVKPEVIEVGKPKFMISGKSGVGKTMFSLSFPGVYFIDTEGGAVREQYKKKLSEHGGMYLGKEQGSQDFQTVIDEIKALATTKHNYKTLVIDSFSHLYNMAAAIAEDKVGNAFGRDKKEANRPTRQLMRWLETVDMTVVLICHSKDKWERRNGEILHVGTTFDGFDKLEYILDLWIEVLKTGKTRTFEIKKSRIDAFVEGEVHDLKYMEFAKLYGKEAIESQAKPLPMATAIQIKKVGELLDIIKLPEETKDKWFEKAGVDKWDDMTEEQIQKCISFCEKKIENLKGGK